MNKIELHTFELTSESLVTNFLGDFPKKIVRMKKLNVRSEM